VGLDLLEWMANHHIGRKRFQPGDKMPGSKALRERIENLVAEAPQLSADVPLQRAWLTAAQYAVGLVCPSANNPYHVRAREIVDTMGPRQEVLNVSQMA